MWNGGMWVGVVVLVGVRVHVCLCVRGGCGVAGALFVVVVVIVWCVCGSECCGGSGYGGVNVVVY